MKPTLIIVEDTEEYKNYLVSILSDEFDIVGTASNGKEAVELCKNIKADLVLMDIVTPIMSGLEATKRIVENSSEPPKVIFLTGLSDETLALKAIEVGAFDYLMKPINKEELCRVLLSYMQNLKNSA